MAEIEFYNTDNECKKLADGLKAARINGNVSVTDMAAGVGCTRNMIYAYEKGNTRIPVNVVIVYAHVLNVSPAVFFGRRDKVANADLVKEIWNEVTRLPESQLEAIALIIRGYEKEKIGEKRKK